jgi:hypothetical protein
MGGHKRFDTKVWKVYPKPPLNTVVIRQRLRTILPEVRKPWCTMRLRHTARPPPGPHPVTSPACADV